MDRPFSDLGSVSMRSHASRRSSCQPRRPGFAAAANDDALPRFARLVPSTKLHSTSSPPAPPPPQTRKEVRRETFIGSSFIEMHASDENGLASIFCQGARAGKAMLVDTRAHTDATAVFCDCERGKGGGAMKLELFPESTQTSYRNPLRLKEERPDGSTRTFTLRLCSLVYAHQHLSGVRIEVGVSAPNRELASLEARLKGEKTPEWRVSIFCHLTDSRGFSNERKAREITALLCELGRVLMTARSLPLTDAEMDARYPAALFASTFLREFMVERDDGTFEWNHDKWHRERGANPHVLDHTLIRRMNELAKAAVVDGAAEAEAEAEEEEEEVSTEEVEARPAKRMRRTDSIRTAAVHMRSGSVPKYSVEANEESVRRTLAMVKQLVGSDALQADFSDIERIACNQAVNMGAAEAFAEL